MTTAVCLLLMFIGPTVDRVFARQTPGPARTAVLIPVAPPVETEAELRRKIADAPGELQPYVDLASLYAWKGRVKEAEQVLRDALASHTRSDDVYRQLVSLFLIGPAKNPARALMIAEEWLHASPASLNAVLLTAAAHRHVAIASNAHSDEALRHVNAGLQVLDDGAAAGLPANVLGRTRLDLLRTKVPLVSDDRAREVLEAEINTLAKSYPPPAFKLPPLQAPFATLPANVARVGGDVRPPQKIKDVAPVIPYDALQAGVEGTVTLDILIENGKVTNARVLRSIPLLDQAAVATVRQWEYAPTVVNARPLALIMTVTVDFRR
jgi:TonB family protein